MNSRNLNFFAFFFSFIDLCALNLVHLVIIFTGGAALVSDTGKYSTLFVIMNVSWLVCAYVSALYISDKYLTFERFTKKTLQCFLLFALTVLLFIFLYNFDYSRLFVTLSFTGFSVCLCISRALFFWASGYLNNHQKFTRKIVILGYNDTSKKLVSHFIQKDKTVSVKGCFEDYDMVNELSTVPIIGEFNDCVPYSILNKVSEIYCTVAPERHSVIYEMARHAEKNFIRFKFVPDFKMFVVNRSIHFNSLDDIPVLSFRTEPLEDVSGQVKKRIFDVVFSLFVIIGLLSWLVPLIAILIKLDSRGPVFFVQQRSGKYNRSFACFKFRSLKVNHDADKRQVSRDDDRFTRLGKFLRRTNIDELPQFINVLLGNMSIVGPRPHMLRHTEMYAGLLDQYMVRHFLKPGITGWAQVNGFRGETHSIEQMAGRVEHDIWYLENWSLWLDIRIIYLTIMNSVRGEKNAF